MLADASELIVAGFEPFNGRRHNRAWEVVRRVRPRSGLSIVQLPVDFARLRDAVPRLMGPEPSGLLLVGESQRAVVCVEQIAVNVLDAATPDNAGAMPRGQAIVAGGPLALSASWNARAIADRLNQGGVTAVASFHAGTFACNAALYGALLAFPAPARIGFLHVPNRRWPWGPRLGVLVGAVEVCLAALQGDAPGAVVSAPRPPPWASG